MSDNPQDQRPPEEEERPIRNPPPIADTGRDTITKGDDPASNRETKIYGPDHKRD